MDEIKAFTAQDPTSMRKSSEAAGKAHDGKLQGEPLRQVSQQFEALFMNMLMKSMRATIKKGKFLNGGRGEEVFSQLMDSNLTEKASKHGKGIGIANMIVKAYERHAKATAGEQKGTQVDTGAVGAEQR